jgi:hypothetical protein
VGFSCSNAGCGSHPGSQWITSRAAEHFLPFRHDRFLFLAEFRQLAAVADPAAAGGGMR